VVLFILIYFIIFIDFVIFKKKFLMTNILFFIQMNLR